MLSSWCRGLSPRPQKRSRAASASTAIQSHCSSVIMRTRSRVAPPNARARSPRARDRSRRARMGWCSRAVPSAGDSCVAAVLWPCFLTSPASLDGLPLGDSTAWEEDNGLPLPPFRVLSAVTVGREVTAARRLRRPGPFAPFCFTVGAAFVGAAGPSVFFTPSLPARGLPPPCFVFFSPLLASPQVLYAF